MGLSELASRSGDVGHGDSSGRVIDPCFGQLPRTLFALRPPQKSWGRGLRSSADTLETETPVGGY